MTTRSWLRKLFASRTPRTIRKGPDRCRPRLEALEDRLAPATLTVNSTADTANVTDAYLSLREAIAIVNSATLPSGLSAQITGQISGTLHAGGTDTIQFDHTTVTTSITLGGKQLELTLPGSTAALTIDGGTTGITVDGNHASKIFQVDGGVQATLTNLTLTHGQNPFGGGTDNGGTLTISNSTLADNSAAGGFGGGIDNGGTLTISNSTLTGNSAAGGFGGGIDNGGTLTISNSILTGNSATMVGGGIYNAGTLTIGNSTLTGNSTAGQGGGILNERGTVAVRNSTLAGNSAKDGGGISNEVGTVAVSNSTLAGNSVVGNGVGGDGDGGGIFNGDTLTISNSTLTGNSASFDGGGIFNYLGTLTIGNNTLAGNSAGDLGGGIYSNVPFTLNNTIVASSPAGGDVAGSFTGSHNLFGSVALGPLANDGGPTQTMAPPAGSPAIDAGDSSLVPIGVTTDQRGFARISGAAVDIGAFEVQQPSFSTTTLANGTYGTAYSRTIMATATGGAAGPFTFAVRPGTLPPGLVLGRDGTLSGTPTAAGSFSFTVTATDNDADAGSQSYTLTIDPALSATGVKVNATAGAPFSGAVVTFTNADPFGSAASYTALITWGDGSTSAGVISSTGSTLTVSGTHTYAAPGSETISVQISHNLGYTTTATTSSTATVTSLGQGVPPCPADCTAFWHSRYGQALLQEFNGGPAATALSAWLASTFPNLYGPGAGLAGASNTQVAGFYQAQFALGGLGAEVLAVALDVYASTASLGGDAAAAVYFPVSATGLGADAFWVGRDGAAFGVADVTILNVYQLLQAVNQRAVNGVPYNGNPALGQQASEALARLLGNGQTDD
jgi:hypothetical protein